MGIRRRGREAAFQMIFEIDLSGLSYGEAVDPFFDQTGTPHKARDFMHALVNGTREHLEEIDELISSHSHHWKIYRMNSVDKNVLRLSVYELLHCKETPTKVIINEAIEIGKKYGTGESGSFINGILDRIAKEVRPDGAE